MLPDVPTELSEFSSPLETTRLRWRLLSTGLGRFLLADAGRGLCFLGLGGERDMGQLEAFAARHMPGALFEEDHGALRTATQALEAYAAGEKRRLELPLDLRGAPFHRAVWQALLDVPFGKTTTYGELARRLGRPGASRAVGQAAGANPVPIAVPCHRVLARGGLGGFSGGLEAKQRLLAHEGLLLQVA